MCLYRTSQFAPTVANITAYNSAFRFKHLKGNIGGRIMGKEYSKEAFIEHRQQQINEILGKLEEGVHQVFTSENYIKYLETFSKFHDYSFNNIILILMQCPQASFVASYQDWNKKFERVVKKGEHGIKILVPTPKKITIDQEVNNPDGSTSIQQVESKRLYFKPGYVYDISQTIGKELPSLTRNLEYNSNVLSKLINLLFASSQIPITYDYNLKEKDANGYYNLTEKKIYLKSSLSDLHKLKTIIHEYSHFLQETQYQKQTHDYTRNTKEVIAESTAFCVIEMLNNSLNISKLSSEEYSFGYIAGWGSRDLKELKQTLNIISKISNSIFEWISKQFVVA